MGSKLRVISVGMQCNNHCIHCFNLVPEEKTSSLFSKSTEALMRQFREAKESGVEMLVLTGGEPTIRDDFIFLMEVAASNFEKVSLQTNGRMFCSNELSSEMARFGDKVEYIIPFHHIDENIFDSITQVKSSYQQTLKGIKNLISVGASDICIKVVILKQNYTCLREIVKLSNELGIKMVNMTFVEGDTGNPRSNWPGIVPRYSDVQPHLSAALDYAERCGIKVHCYDIPFCFLGEHRSCAHELDHYIKPYLVQDFHKRISNKEEDVLRDIVLRRRIKQARCSACRYFRLCLGVWKEYIAAYGEDEFIPLPGLPVEKLSEI